MKMKMKKENSSLKRMDKVQKPNCTRVIIIIMNFILSIHCCTCMYAQNSLVYSNACIILYIYCPVGRKT